MQIALGALLYIVALLGFGASSLLAADYSRATSAICGPGGGCEIVRASDYAQLLGVKTPFFGILFFTVAIVLALWPARRALVAWTAAGGLGALAFLAIQAFVLHAFCKYCLVADGGALALLGLAIATRKETRAPRARTAVLVGSIAAGLALAPLAAAPRPPAPVPAIAAGQEDGPVPDVIVKQQQPGVATIVEFVDFECPFCRRLHAYMEAVVPAYGDKVRVIRKQLPLATIHKNAMSAALAACCAEEAGAGDKMADALFSAPPDDLTPEGCERIAAKVGLDVDSYRACMASDRPRKQIEADAADAEAAGLGQSVPVFYVGRTLYKGAQGPEIIRAAIDKELARR